MNEVLRNTEQMPSVKVIVFDFDGVLVRRSEFFKREAWEELFKSDSARWKLFEEAEAKYGQGRGGDRYDIIRFVMKGVSPYSSETEIEARVQDLATQYDAIVQKKIAHVDIDPTDRAILERLSKKYSLYVNSATPKETLEKTIANLGLTGVFKGVLGRPLSKPENFKLVAENEGVKMGEVLFVGDGESDFKASEVSQCRFLGISNDWNNWKEGAQAFPIIRALEDIENWTQ